MKLCVGDGVAKMFFQELQEEALKHKLEQQAGKIEVLGDVAGASQRLWTSDLTMR